jgi:hypothetical protein
LQKICQLIIDATGAICIVSVLNATVRIRTTNCLESNFSASYRWQRIARSFCRKGFPLAVAANKKELRKTVEDQTVSRQARKNYGATNW